MGSGFPRDRRRPPWTVDLFLFLKGVRGGPGSGSGGERLGRDLWEEVKGGSGRACVCMGAWGFRITGKKWELRLQRGAGVL